MRLVAEQIWGHDNEFIVTMLCFRCVQGGHMEIFSGQVALQDWSSEQKSQWDAKDWALLACRKCWKDLMSRGKQGQNEERPWTLSS